MRKIEKLTLKEKILRLPPDKKRKALEILAEKKRRREEEKYQYFVPNGKQEEFVKLVGDGQTFVCLLVAGNGLGKSAVLVNILANMMFKPVGKWFKDLPLFEKYPYLKDIRIASDPSTVINKIVPEMKKWFPKGQYTSVKAGKMYESQWKTTTGFKLDILTYEQQPKEFESADRGLIIFDEPPPVGIYKASISRLRSGGMMILGFTPTIESHSEWIKDELLDKPGLIRDKYVGFVRGDIEDNCKEHGVRGILNHKEIDRILATYNKWDLEARAHGKWTHLIGRIFKDHEMTQGVQIIKPFDIPNSWDRFRAIDWGFNNPTACLWVAIDPDDNWYVYKEHKQEGLRVEEQAEIIKGQTNKSSIRYTLIDPSTTHDIGDGSETIFNQFREAGVGPLLMAENKPGSRWGGINKIKELLQVGSKTGKPRMRIFNDCDKLLWEMNHYITHQFKHQLDKNPKEEPRKKDDHLIDCLRYLALKNPRYFGQQYSMAEEYSGDRVTGY